MYDALYQPLSNYLGLNNFIDENVKKAILSDPILKKNLATFFKPLYTQLDTQLTPKKNIVFDWDKMKMVAVYQPAEEPPAYSSSPRASLNK